MSRHTTATQVFREKTSATQAISHLQRLLIADCTAKTKAVLAPGEGQKNLVKSQLLRTDTEACAPRDRHSPKYGAYVLLSLTDPLAVHCRTRNVDERRA